MIEFCDHCGHRIYATHDGWCHMRTHDDACDGGTASPNPDRGAGQLRFDLLICEEVGVAAAIAMTTSAAQSSLQPKGNEGNDG